jgi:hypothetical protein
MARAFTWAASRGWGWASCTATCRPWSSRRARYPASAPAPPGPSLARPLANVGAEESSNYNHLFRLIRVDVQQLLASYPAVVAAKTLSTKRDAPSPAVGVVECSSNWYPCELPQRCVCFRDFNTGFYSIL